jgi:hypothetical protein
MELAETSSKTKSLLDTDRSNYQLRHPYSLHDLVSK